MEVGLKLVTKKKLAGGFGDCSKVMELGEAGAGGCCYAGGKPRLGLGDTPEFCHSGFAKLADRTRS